MEQLQSLTLSPVFTGGVSGETGGETDPHLPSDPSDTAIKDSEIKPGVSGVFQVKQGGETLSAVHNSPGAVRLKIREHLLEFGWPKSADGNDMSLRVALQYLTPMIPGINLSALDRAKKDIADGKV